MNTERILRLADTIEANPDTVEDFEELNPESRQGFTMQCFYHPCGTPGCVGGWAHYQGVEDGFFTRKPRFFHSDLLEENRTLEGYLGISSAKAEELFYPSSDSSHGYSWVMSPARAEDGGITSRHAAAVLRHLAETGEVDWSVQPTDPVVAEAIEELIQTEEPVSV